MLAPLARATAKLLISAERNLVRQCANERCGHLFMDTTKNHQRHWCKADCGSHVRVRRYRQRQRDERASDREE
ncbi:CGNR zinc finger domain-containing protein [Ktedonosporobacter rubrisoli]